MPAGRRARGRACGPAGREPYDRLGLPRPEAADLPGDEDGGDLVRLERRDGVGAEIEPDVAARLPVSATARGEADGLPPSTLTS